MTAVHVVELGRQPYGDVLELQRALCRARIAGTLGNDVLLLVEHPDVVTLGRGTQASSRPHDDATLAQLGYEVFDIERGGDVTYHGPGQLVGYPIFDLNAHRRDLHWYLRQLESALIEALARLGVDGERVAGLTGVWTHGRKIASIGVHVKRWVTFHGFALNVHTDLSRFGAIVPCGIADVQMTSIARELGDRTAPTEVWTQATEAVIAAVGEVFERDPVRTPVEALTPSLERAAG